jgi:hypothetical protein
MSDLPQRLRLAKPNSLTAAVLSNEAADRIEALEAELATKPKTLMARMDDGNNAMVEAEARLSEIIGIELLGIGWDWYDTSFEIYPLDAEDVVLTPEQHAAILALGCARYWINFRDGTERYCNGNRKQSSSNRWDEHNHGKERKRREEAELERVGQDARRLDWLERKLFSKHWNGVVGSGAHFYWRLVGYWRHIIEGMRGDSLRNAIDSELDAEAAAQNVASARRPDETEPEGASQDTPQG